MEVWRDVVGYEGAYQVSNFGRVRRIASGKGSFHGKILKPKTNDRGVREVNLSINSTPKSKSVHRLVALAFLGEPPTDRHLVAHNDGNPSNNRLANLRWATKSENSYDQVLHGTQKGKHYGRKSALTHDDVIRIRADKRMQAEIAKDYGLSPATIGQIRRRETYKYIPEADGDYRPSKAKIGFSHDEIRRIRSDTRSASEIAREVGCSVTSICSIKNGDTYAHVSDEVAISGSVGAQEVEENYVCVIGDVAIMELASGHTAILDADDAEILRGKRWFTMKGKNTRYVVSRTRHDDGRVTSISLHRLLTDAPDDMVVDHINGDGLDNRRSNLRVVTVSQNNLNSRVRKDSISGLKGAFYDKTRGVYYSRIKTLDGKKVWLGYHDTAEAAAQAYADASAKYHGEFGRSAFDD